ncbi:target of myb protein 1 [Trichuris trichiura]|uniref:Target of myb protein 1 n=1 Tax=Trichuris trichiura TaxID=36087 RepID=A0A077ZE88_TRITR|nr:target of myb protein 1 [Trichuris trichiura]
MEHAREAAQAVTEFFQGNPFQTPIGKKIVTNCLLAESITESTLEEEDWAIYMEICDMISSQEDGPRDAIRAIRKRLQQNMGKNHAIVSNTLVVLDTCVKNCGPRFYCVVAQKDFLHELVRLIGTKYDPPLSIQVKVLSMIRQWAEAFRGQPEYSDFCDVYDELVTKGVEFPAQEALDAPIVTPKPSFLVTSPSVGNRSCQRNVSDEQLVKLRSELDVVNENLNVFREMLTELQPGQENPDDLRMLKDLNDVCREMQRRIIVLIQQIKNDAVTSELLIINDELNTVFAKYDRYMTNRESATQSPAGKSDKAEIDEDTALIDLSDVQPVAAGTELRKLI